MKIIIELLRSYADFIVKQLLLKCIMLPNLMLFKVLTPYNTALPGMPFARLKEFQKKPHHPFIYSQLSFQVLF